MIKIFFTLFIAFINAKISTIKKNFDHRRNRTRGKCATTSCTANTNLTQKNFDFRKIKKTVSI